MYEIVYQNRQADCSATAPMVTSGSPICNGGSTEGSARRVLLRQPQVEWGVGAAAYRKNAEECEAHGAQHCQRDHPSILLEHHAQIRLRPPEEGRATTRETPPLSDGPNARVRFVHNPVFHLLCGLHSELARPFAKNQTSFFPPTRFGPSGERRTGEGPVRHKTAAPMRTC
jgi:hypothetical protein